MRLSAYQAMREVIQWNPREQLTLNRARFPEQVDWALVDSYLPGDESAAQLAEH